MPYVLRKLRKASLQASYFFKLSWFLAEISEIDNKYVLFLGIPGIIDIADHDGDDYFIRKCPTWPYEMVRVAPYRVNFDFLALFGHCRVKSFLRSFSR